MSVTANDKGAVEQRVILQKRGTGKIQHVLLKSTLIKKAHNYGLMTDRFLTNHFPPILQEQRELMRIVPRFGYLIGNEQFDVSVNHQGEYNRPEEANLEKISVFDAFPIYSVARLCEGLAQFVRTFNRGLYLYGADYSNVNDVTSNRYATRTQHSVPRHQIIIDQFANPNQHHPHDLNNYIDPEDVGYSHTITQEVHPYIALGFTPDGNVQLSMSSHFLSNFYIEFDPVFAQLIGFPQYVYARDDQVGNISLSNSGDPFDLFAAFGTDDEKFDLHSAIHQTANELPRTIESTKSIFRCDTRLSIDIEISLPLSHSIDIYNGSETHTYVLNRYMITDYVTVEGKTQQTGGHILTKSIIQDKLNIGCTDLVANQPSSHTAQLLPGKIQEMDIRLVLRHKQYARKTHPRVISEQPIVLNARNRDFYSLPNQKLSFTIERTILEMDETGLYDLLLAFNKRV